MTLRRLGLVALCLCLAGCDREDGTYREGEFLFQATRPAGFDALGPARRRFAFHLTEALRLGADVHWYQASRDGTEVRDLLLDVWADRGAVPRRYRASLARDLARTLIAHRPAVRDLDRAGFAKIVRSVGKRRTPARADQLRVRVRHADAAMFGGAASAAGFDGADVTREDFDALDERGAIDQTTVVSKDAGAARTRRAHVGGLFGQDLAAVDHHLGLAAAFATPAEAAYLARVRVALATGFAAHWREAERVRRAGVPTDLDFFIGPRDRSDDPFGRRGAWEGWVVVLAPAADRKRREFGPPREDVETLYSVGHAQVRAVEAPGPAGEPAVIPVNPTLELDARGEVTLRPFRPRRAPVADFVGRAVSEARHAHLEFAKLGRCDRLFGRGDGPG